MKTSKQKETVIDWSRVPEGYDWVAMDEDEDWFAYTKEPTLETNEWKLNGLCEYISSPSIIKNAPSDWKQCKFKRP